MKTLILAALITLIAGAAEAGTGNCKKDGSIRTAVVREIK